MFQSLKSFKIKALCTKSETLKRLCPIELQFIENIITVSERGFIYLCISLFP